MVLARGVWWRIFGRRWGVFLTGSSILRSMPWDSPPDGLRCGERLSQEGWGITRGLRAENPEIRGTFISVWRGAQCKESGEGGGAGEVAVHFAGAGAAFVDGPDDEGLAAAAVAAVRRRRTPGSDVEKRPVVGLEVGAGIEVDVEGFGEMFFGAEEAHGEEDEVGGGKVCSLPGTLSMANLPGVVFDPGDADGAEGG